MVMEANATEFFRQRSAMNLEWDAWQKVVFEAQRMGIDMDLPKWDRLFRAIALWGEYLHVLRMGQDADQVATALRQNTERYDAAVKADN